MAQSPPRSGRPPIQQLQTVADLLETPALARLYAHILQHGPVTVSEVLDELDIPQGTAYDYVQNLETAGLVEKTRDQRPYEYDAESIALTLSTDGETQTITPALIAAVARIRRRSAAVGRSLYRFVSVSAVRPSSTLSGPRPVLRSPLSRPDRAR